MIFVWLKLKNRIFAYKEERNSDAAKLTVVPIAGLSPEEVEIILARSREAHPEASAMLARDTGEILPARTFSAA